MIATYARNAPLQWKNRILAAYTTRLSRFAPLARLALIALLCAAPPDAMAQSEARLRAHYVATLIGITVGSGSWDVRIAPDHFIVTGNGGSSGLARLFSSGRAEAIAEGPIRNGKPAPQRYDYTSTTTKKFDEIHMRLAQNAVTELRIEPPQNRHRKRVPLEPQHQIGVLDPIAAVMLPTPGPLTPGPLTPGQLGPETCARNLPVFDGRMRYDLHFAFKRMEQVKTNTGYQGPVAVCAIRFTPIAGHIPERPAIKYLTELTTMEVWLAPVAGTSLAVPWKVIIPTPYGTGVLQAETFRVTAN